MDMKSKMTKLYKPHFRLRNTEITNNINKMSKVMTKIKSFLMIWCKKKSSLLPL